MAGTTVGPALQGLERLSDVTKVRSIPVLTLCGSHQLSPHVTRILGQNPSIMTLQGTNSYLLQPPSNPLAPLILVDSSSPHTAQQYISLLMTHLHHLALESGIREVHFESGAAKDSLKYVPEERRGAAKAEAAQHRLDNPTDGKVMERYGHGAQWEPTMTKERKLPTIEHIILTHRHLDHVGAIPALLKELKAHGMTVPKIWKMPSPDEEWLMGQEREKATSDKALVDNLPDGLFTRFSPHQALHPIIPGLMISIIDPEYRHLLKHDKVG